MESNELKVGDVVVIKSDSKSKMTVNIIYDYGVECVYFYEGEMKKVVISPKALQKND